MRRSILAAVAALAGGDAPAQCGIVDRVRDVAVRSGPAVAPRVDLFPRVAPPDPVPAAAPGVPQLAPAARLPGDEPLPINLPAALRLADARPLVVQAAEASLAAEAGRLQQARALWLPTVAAGVSYTRHDGDQQIVRDGKLTNNSRNELLVGAGPRLSLVPADAVYAPLVARRLVAARTVAVQAAKNDALADTAEAYFRVQEARGRLAGLRDATDKGTALVARIDKLGRGLAAPIEADRARAQLAELDVQLAAARRDWRQASATLTRVLRLNPLAVVEPVEPPDFRVTLIDPRTPVGELLPVALTHRPELANRQALVQAALARVRQEQVRPLVPTVVVQGSAVPGNTLAAGVYSTGVNDRLATVGGRSDLNFQLVWQLENLGFGNRGRVAERRGEQQAALVELLRTQDGIAAEVAQAHADVEAAAAQVPWAAAGLATASATFAANLRGIAETVRAGERLQLVVRPQEAVVALDALSRAYANYYAAVNGYNRAQFRLYRACGYAPSGANPPTVVGGLSGPAAADIASK